MKKELIYLMVRSLDDNQRFKIKVGCSQILFYPIDSFKEVCEKIKLYEKRRDEMRWSELSYYIETTRV